MDFNSLISLKPCGHEYFLWINDVTESSLVVKATDGYRVWEQSVEAKKNKPKSRKETDQEYIELILKCLTNLDVDKRDYSITVSVSGSLQFMVKEKLGSMMALLLKLDMMENFDAATKIREILQNVCDQNTQSAQALSDATNDVLINRKANDSLTQTILAFSKDKEEFQNEFFKKMCIIVNCKKREIRLLQSEVSSLEDEVSGLKAKLASVSKGKSTKTAVQKAKKSKSKAEQVQVEDEEVIYDSGVSSEEDEASTEESRSEGESEAESDVMSEEPDSLSSVTSPNKSTGRANSKRKPPSYVQQPAKGLKKMKTAAASQSSSQVLTQVLAPSVGSMETTSGDLTRILSESTQVTESKSDKPKRGGRRRVVDTQEEEINEVVSSKAMTSTYQYDDDSDGESDACNDTEVTSKLDQVDNKVDTPPAVAKSKTKAKAKKSVFDKLYKDSSSSEDEGASVMDYL
mmetsp:Transcript_5014/g.9463  ORF Transcript_5014/g.9463 Transcript_5014/m.9463 type:complete len:460 (+) Transcript_5014:29-1408(+)